MLPDNKNSYFKMVFRLNRDVSTFDEGTKLINTATDRIEPILGQVQADSETYIIYKKTSLKKIVFLYKTKSRKRLAFIRNSINKHLPDIRGISFKTERDRLKWLYENKDAPVLESVEALTKKQFIEEFEEYRKNKEITIQGDVDK